MSEFAKCLEIEKYLYIDQILHVAKWLATLIFSDNILAKN